MVFFIFVSIITTMLIGCKSMSNEQFLRAEEIILREEKASKEQDILIESAWNEFTNEMLKGKLESNSDSISYIKKFLIRDNQEATALINEFASTFMPTFNAKYEETKKISVSLEMEIQNLSKNITPNLKHDDKYQQLNKNLILSLIAELRLQTDISDLYLRYLIGGISDEELQILDLKERLYSSCIFHYKNKHILNEEQFIIDDYLKPLFIYMPKSYTKLMFLKDEMEKAKKLYNQTLEMANKIGLLTFNASPSALFICKYRFLLLSQCYNETIAKIKDFYLNYDCTDMGGSYFIFFDDQISDHLNYLIQRTNISIKKLNNLNCYGFGAMDIICSSIKIPQKNYYFGKYEVTQQQWSTLMGYNPSYFKGNNLPVENVSWNECQKFCDILNKIPNIKSMGYFFRLPTKEEWEEACRANSSNNYGLIDPNTEGNISDMGWYFNNSSSKTHNVGEKCPNYFGLYDMHGNVWEWTSSTSGAYRIRSGGCWDNNAHFCRSYSYTIDTETNKNNTIGFRILFSINP